MMDSKLLKSTDPNIICTVYQLLKCEDSEDRKRSSDGDQVPQILQVEVEIHTIQIPAGYKNNSDPF